MTYNPEPNRLVCDVCGLAPQHIDGNYTTLTAKVNGLRLCDVCFNKWITVQWRLRVAAV